MGKIIFINFNTKEIQAEIDLIKTCSNNEDLLPTEEQDNYDLEWLENELKESQKLNKNDGMLSQEEINALLDCDYDLDK